MKKMNVLLFLLTVISITFASCSSSKGGKGGGWYRNRNVQLIKMEEQPSIVYQSAEIQLEKSANPKQSKY